MTHAQSPRRSKALRHRTDAARPEARARPPAALPVRSDPAWMADWRRLADDLEIPGECGRDECRRAGRCSGPVGTAVYFPEEPMPACLAGMFEEIYAPVAEWNAMIAAIREAQAKLRRRGPVREPEAPARRAQPSGAF